MAAHQQRRPSSIRLARALAWIGIGIGAVELLAPRRTARALGIPGSAHLLQAFGAREIAVGVGILESRDPRPWVLGRVAGDTLDAATLLVALSRKQRRTGTAMLALATVAAATALDLICAETLRTDNRPGDLPDYSDRSGFPRGVDAMRGAARAAHERGSAPQLAAAS